MKTSQALIAALSLALAMGAAQAQTQASPHDHGDKPAAADPAKPAAHEGAPAAPAAHAGGPGMMDCGAMRCGDGMKMPMSGDVDKDFAAMMIMHHRHAIRMADIEIAHGKDEALKAMARKMREHQLAEIAKLEKHR